MNVDPYASGLLKNPDHGPLVANLTRFARDAGVQPHWVWTPIEEFCSVVEQQYVDRFRCQASYGVAGLCYLGLSGAEVRNRMAAITGKLMRNFIRARVMTLSTVLETIASEGGVTATCLLIPNFFIPRAEGGSLASWQARSLLDLLIQRQAEGLQTVISVADKMSLGKEYGKPFVELIDTAYQIIQI